MLIIKKQTLSNIWKKYSFGNFQNEATELSKKSISLELDFPKIGEEQFILSFYFEANKV